MTVIFIDMPTTVKGFARRTPDGDVIVINARLSVDAQRATYIHELRHLKEDDFEKAENADQIEFLKHKKCLPPKDDRPLKKGYSE